jgi:predicted RNase H-like HicB family nuclease
MNKYTVVVHRVGPSYVALCLELNVVRQGPTFDQVRESIVEAIKDRLTALRHPGVSDETRFVPLEFLPEFLPEADLFHVASAGYPFSRN